MNISLSFKRFFGNFLIRTLKVNILTIFLSLTIFTFFCVMLFSFFKSYQSIMVFSHARMERNSLVIINKIQQLETSIEDSLQDTSGLFINAKNLVVENKQLVTFLLNALKYNSDLSSMFLATESGDFIQVVNLSLSTQKYYIADPEKPLPDNSAYAVRLLDVDQKNPEEIWEYRDAQLNLLDTETVMQNMIKVRERPWYTGAVAAKDIFWTDIYIFSGTKEPGVSAGMPVYDPDGKLLGVLGADLSFVALNQFLSTLKIGNEDHSFIVEGEGTVVIPSTMPEKMKKSAPILSEAFKYFKKTKDYNFTLTFKKRQYLIYISHLPVEFGKHWYIVIVAPFSEFFSGLMKTQGQILLMTLLILLISVLIIIYFSKRISYPIVSLSKEVDKITNLNLDSTKRVSSKIIEIRTMDASIAAMRATLRSFAKYVPKEIVKQLLQKGKDISLKVEKKSLTILFSDIQDFTSIIETNPLDKVMPLLSQYFDGLSRIILDNGGTIDKYIGDSVMAFWGAPIDIEDHAYLACTSALRCHAYVNQFNKKCREQGKLEFITRFGISSGNVVVGNIGTFERMNYTVIGDAVNTAARLQVTDKVYHVSIIIGERVYRQVKDRVLTRVLDKVTVKGKQEEIKIYELVAAPQEEDKEIQATAAQKELCETFNQAYEAYSAGDFNQATQLFEAIHKKFPDDYPTQLYIQRLKSSK